VSKPPQTITRVIMGALVIWGSVLAVGAWKTGGDLRKPCIVLACTFGFLLLWWIVLKYASTRGQNPVADEKIGWNVSALVSFSLLPIISLGLAWDFWLDVLTGRAAHGLRVGMLALMMVSMIAAIVGLSDPRPSRGKLLGLISLSFCLVVGMVAMVYPL